MLVLTRKRTESIKIGPNIILKVLEVGTKTIRLGIEAPPEVPIVRGELSDLPRDRPHVAEAVVDFETEGEEPMVLGPMTAEQFLKEFNGFLPRRGDRRTLPINRLAWKPAAK